MTGAGWLLASVAFLLAVALITAALDRWQNRQRILPRLREIGRETGDDERAIDVLKSADVLPFRKVD